MSIDIIKSDKLERAVLISLRIGRESKVVVEEHLDELERLTDTAGAETIFKILQDRAKPDTAFYIGKGKAEEVAQLIELNDIDIIIFDDDLTPTQVRNLEKLMNKKIIDRSGLILDIFASRAQTREAKTQVELAQLQYMLPRLSRAWTHLSKQYGGIGTKGPGETQIETDRRIIRTRIAKLKERLGKIESQTTIKSTKRKEHINVSLVGYTNAGKSTLLNQLTGSDVLAEDKLFATLDSTTRSVQLEKNKEIMLSDTVGFIRKLPHHLVASFKTTLNVVKDADYILHVIDISHPYFEDHIRVVDETLKELDCDKKKQLKIFNKVDALSDKNIIEYVRNKFNDSIIISAARGINISVLKERLNDFYSNKFIEETITLNAVESKIISQLHASTEVISVKYIDEKVVVTFRTDSPNYNRLRKIYESKLL